MEVKELFHRVCAFVSTKISVFLHQKSCKSGEAHRVLSCKCQSTVNAQFLQGSDLTLTGTKRSFPIFRNQSKFFTPVVGWWVGSLSTFPRHESLRFFVQYQCVAHVGDIIRVLHKDVSGWWTGQLNSNRVCLFGEAAGSGSWTSLVHAYEQIVFPRTT